MGLFMFHIFMIGACVLDVGCMRHLLPIWHVRLFHASRTDFGRNIVGR